MSQPPLQSTPPPPYELEEGDVHNKVSMFMCTGFTHNDCWYFAKPSFMEVGDYESKTSSHSRPFLGLTLTVGFVAQSAPPRL